jgi:hypothetical protein
VVVVLFIAGDQVPEIPLFETAARVKISPEHIGGTWVNTGVIRGSTVTVIMAVIAHWPIDGVNVYVVVAVLLIAGDQAPFIPLSDDDAKVKEPPEHIGDTWVNIGVINGFTVTVIEAAVAHSPVVGVKVYEVVVVLSIAGDQVPVILLFDVGDKAKTSPEQIGANWVNVGVIKGSTTIVIEVVLAHCPTVGVKVYVEVLVLLIVGDQVPLMLLLEVVGKVNEPPEHIGDTWVNIGVSNWLIVTVIEAVVAHSPAVGVNV